jgi:hypothetical protein
LKSRPSNIENTYVEHTSHQGIHCSEAAPYTLMNTKGHRYQPTTEAHRLAHKEFAWPRAGTNGQDLKIYKIISNTVNRKPNFNCGASNRIVVENCSLATDGIILTRTTFEIHNTANTGKNNEELSETASHPLVRHLRQTQRQKGVDGQRQTPRTNQIGLVTATAPRPSRELKLSTQEMDFRETMESEMSMLRKRKDRTGSEDTASEHSEGNQSISGVQLNTDTDNEHVTQSGNRSIDDSRAQLGRESGAQSTVNRASNSTMTELQSSVASPLPLSQLLC